MNTLGCASRAFIVVAAASLSTLAVAQSQSALGTIAENDSVFVDGRTFEITPGKAKRDASVQIKRLGARELGPGAIIFRSREKLYVLDVPLSLQNGRLSGRSNAYVTADKDEEQPNRVVVEYVSPKNPEHQKLYEMIKERHVLEMVQNILSPLRLPGELTIKTLGCEGLVNSWYNTDNSIPTVHMCYELLQNIIQTKPRENAAAKFTPHEAIVGQFLFWTLHELGHAMFDIFELPLFGREEDAADQFAGYMMLQFGKEQAHRWIEGAAFTAEEFMTDSDRMANYSSVHGLPQQRFYNLLCLAYGADPTLFADLTENVLPKKRANNCEYEYQTFMHAFRREILPHIDMQMARAVLKMSWFPEPRSQPHPR